MNESRLEIKIIKDVNEKNIDLKAMSLRAAQSFLLLFESVTKIVELTPDNKEVEIQVTSGSAVIAAEGEPITKAQEEFEKILENKSTNKEIVEQWRRIQSVFTENGLQYEGNFVVNGERIPFYEILRKRKSLRAKPITPKRFTTELEFLTGKLIAVGGKSPNIHVEVDGQTISPIACTETNASKAKVYLYQTILFSSWARKADGTKRYTLCDSYGNENIYDELKTFISKFYSLEQVEALKLLHYQCRKYLENQDYGKLRKFFRLFIHDSTDINIIKIILIVTQSVKEHGSLKIAIEELQSLFDKQFKYLNKKNLSES